MSRVAFRVPKLSALRGLTAAVLIALMVAPTICLADASRNGSWFVDTVKYHVSAHGRISCQDCHPDVIQQHTHPDPAHVNGKRRDFFTADSCFNCHDGEGINGNLQKGLHGGKSIKIGVDYARCIECHDPHYQPRLTGKSATESNTAELGGDRCAACHKKRQTVPPPKGEDVKCVGCHKAPDEEGSGRAQTIAVFCLHCHGRKPPVGHTAVAAPLIDPIKHASKRHERLDCMACHPESAKFEHNRQRPGDCRGCHAPHHEATIHEAHSGVSCEACHLTGIKPGRDPETGQVVRQLPSRSAGMRAVGIRNPGSDTAYCKECHYKGNALGAVALILPAKSVICMPCHTATFSAGDPITVLALVGFALGLCAVVSVWVSGASDAWPDSTGSREKSRRFHFLDRAAMVLKALVLDALLQRRLFRQSPQRWLIHGLIFWPFVLRFGWGLTALVGSLLWPAQGWVSSMLDKNAPLTALWFDFTGLMVVLGVILAVIRGRSAKQAESVPGLPERDQWAVGLLAAIVVVGFVLEGARIALTGVGGGARFAFVGWTLSFLWSGVQGLDEIYGYIWYAHALLTGLFLVYLPFSGMLHMLAAPVVAVLNSGDEAHDHRDRP